MEEDLRAALLANPGVAAILGARASWDALPQGTTWPAACLYVVSTVPGYTMKGQDRLVAYRVQIDVTAETVAGSKNAARAVIGALSGLRSGAIEGCFWSSRRDVSTADATEADRLYTVQLDFIVNHKEA
jgi:hypothetical protein